ncbi:DUF3892 domain-containing protein [Asaia sp. As-1742]|uniref:DUF3892 domain-containing protein n=1 Tax=Asaia sp. As-1742 TaxID=2608325 RepID=UPI001421EBC0|nr:DUF3892 domain-containing protein [Asaia sp. As-1742]
MPDQIAQIRCINKRQHPNPHERIISVGGHSGGRSWKISESEAILQIERREWGFFVSVGGHPVAVVVATHNGRKYLKTAADGYEPNNLLSLPECL